MTTVIMRTHGADLSSKDAYITNGDVITDWASQQNTEHYLVSE